MIALGLLLVLVAVALAAISILLTEATGLELAGQVVGPVTLYLAGVVTMLLLVVGLALVRGGTRRSIRQRRERKRLAELSDKLDRVESDRDAGDPPRREPGPDSTAETPTDR